MFLFFKWNCKKNENEKRWCVFVCVVLLLLLLLLLLVLSSIQYRGTSGEVEEKKKNKKNKKKKKKGFIVGLVWILFGLAWGCFRCVRRFDRATHHGFRGRLE